MRIRFPGLSAVPLVLLALAVLAGGRAEPLWAGVTDRDAVCASDFWPPPTAALDPIHILCAREQYGALARARARLHAAVTIQDFRRQLAALPTYRDTYCETYLAVTPTGRLRAHLPLPEGL